MEEDKGSGTTNAILVILVVVIVGFGVWYMTKSDTKPETTNNEPKLEINLGGSDTPTEQPAQ
jgi:uncharacterized protein HemX